MQPIRVKQASSGLLNEFKVIDDSIVNPSTAEEVRQQIEMKLNDYDEVIHFQIGEDGKDWSEVKSFTKATVKHSLVPTFCQTMANALKKSIRMTRPFGDVPIQNLSGEYYNPRR
jgi:hypothetical protein